jgi:hypothetical protein
MAELAIQTTVEPLQHTEAKLADQITQGTTISRHVSNKTQVSRKQRSDATGSELQRQGE